MITKIIKTVRGFSPVELVIMVGFGALAAAALIYLGTTPHYMASSQPVNVNIKVEGAATASRQTSAMAEEDVTAPESKRIPKENVIPPTAKGKMVGIVNPDPGHLKTPSGTPALDNGKENEIWVHPRGQFKEQPQINEYSDIYNVQWAVDNVASGGTVKLMATDPDDNEKKAFYFGEPVTGGSYVELHQSVNVVGEKLGTVSADQWDSTGNYNADFTLPKGGTLKSDRAVVYGGYGTFTVPFGNSFSYTLKSLRTEKSGFASFMFFSGSGTTETSDNVITNGVALENPYYTVPISDGINLGLSRMPATLSGTAHVKNNYIDSYNDPFINSTNGIDVTTSATLDVYIKNNTIDVPDNAILLANSANLDSWVESNKMKSAYNIWNFRTKQSHILNNYIEVLDDPVDGNNCAIYDRQNSGAVIKNNTIVMDNAKIGIVLYLSTNATINIGDGTANSGVGKITGTLDTSYPYHAHITLLRSNYNTVNLDGAPACDYACPNGIYVRQVGSSGNVINP